MLLTPLEGGQRKLIFMSQDVDKESFWQKLTNHDLLTNSNGTLFFWAILDLRWSDTRTPSENPWLLASPDWVYFRPLLRCLNLHASSFNGLCWLLHLSEKLTWPNLRLGVTQLTTWTAPWLQEPHRGPPLLTLPPVSLTAVNNSKFNPIMFSLAGIFPRP